MKFIKQINKGLRYSAVCLFMLGISGLVLSSCDPSLDVYKFDLPEAGSVPDKTPPSADFSASKVEGDWQSFKFSNLSSSATKYSWDFGDGSKATDTDVTHKFAQEGSYTVTLTASDNLNVTSTHSAVIEVVKPAVPVAILPVINEAGFEPGSTACGSAADGRDCWRNSDLGGVIQTTASPVFEGKQAAKFPTTSDRIGYQELKVTPNTNYVLSYYYVLKTSPQGSLTVSVLPGGGYTNLNTALSSAIASFVGTDQSNANQYVKVNIPFNSGANNMVSILITNKNVEGRVDAFSISF